MNAKQLLVMALGSAWFGVAQAQGAMEKPAGAAPNDAQIAEIVVVANQADIDAGKLAKKRAKDPGVKDFASTMIRDHGAVNTAAKDLAKKLKLKPKPSDTSKSLEKASKENLAALKKLHGSAFDKAYIDHEVAYHQQVIDAVNTTLLPNAQNPELKALLEKAGPVFQSHLEHAKQLQSHLGGGGTGGGTTGGTGGGTGGSTQ
jgi:putative membrane protein